MQRNDLSQAKYVFLLIIFIYLERGRLCIGEKEAGHCRFQAHTPTNDNYGSKCAYQSQDRVALFIECKTLPNDDKSLQLCNDIIEQQCLVDIDIENVITHQPLPPSASVCAGDLLYDITVLKAKITKPEDGSSLILFMDSQKTNLKKISILNVVFEPDTLGPFLKNNFATAKMIMLSGVNSPAPITGGSLPPQVSHFSISDSTIGGFEYKSLNMNSELRSIEIRNVVLTKSSVIETEAFTIGRLDCDQQERDISLSIRDCKLTDQSIKKNFILASSSDTFCTQKVRFNFTFTGNDLGLFIHEQMFSDFFKTIQERKDLELVNFEHDKIDCCVNDNRWLLKLIEQNNQTAFGNTILKINCNDLQSNIYDFTRVIRDKDVCYDRNVYPILIIAIISILLLAILMAIFSYICIYHVLPKRGHVIMLGALSSNFSDKSVTKTLATQPSGAAEPTSSNQMEGHQAKILLFSESVRSKETHNKAKVTSPLHMNATKSSKSQILNLNLPTKTYKLPGLKKVIGKGIHHKRMKARKKSHHSLTEADKLKSPQDSTAKHYRTKSSHSDAKSPQPPAKSPQPPAKSPHSPNKSAEKSNDERMSLALKTIN